MHGTWKETSGKLKQRHAILTEDDLLFSKGKEVELLGRLQDKIGTTKEELRKMMGKTKKGSGPGVGACVG
jgi:uncharacterized protein YjbJ (UPF0337 family)